jgi:condensin complex subunit 3
MIMGSVQAEEEETLLREDGDHDNRMRREDERLDKEFVIGEMLKLTVNLDYADEIGCRKMFSLVHE